jgi:hypothetical protein
MDTDCGLCDVGTELSDMPQGQAGEDGGTFKRSSAP